MSKKLDFQNDKKIIAEIFISGSKSESNRALILQKLFPHIIIENLSDSDDTVHLTQALNLNNNVINIGHAGTAMRFLTAYFSNQEGKSVIITGSERMQERPIKILVDALITLGADISYLKEEGYPPLKIIGKKLTLNKVSLQANVSSQYISALLLLAPALENGIELTLEGDITSLPYINMTLALLQKIGVKTIFENHVIKVSMLKIPLKNEVKPLPIAIESDWSSASYYYSLIALSESGSQVLLSNYQQNSLQGDSVLAEIYKLFGVETTFYENKILVKLTDVYITHNNQFPSNNLIALNLNSAPDIAQTIAVTCLGLGLNCHLTGLHTLKIKETDRLAALQTELEKLGAQVVITHNSLTLTSPKVLNKNIKIATYNDHRMAMAFAPLSIVIPIEIENPEVVTKSYKKFWEDWDRVFLK